MPRYLLFSALAAALLAAALAASAQTWPNRPVRMVVPLSPGGFADVARADPRGAAVDRHRRAGGRREQARRRRHDRRGLRGEGAARRPHAGLHRHAARDQRVAVQEPALRPAQGLRARRAAWPQGPYVLVVNPQLPVQLGAGADRRGEGGAGQDRLRELGQRQRASTWSRALFNTMAGINLNHVPYKGSGPAMQDLVLGGQVKVSFAGLPNVADARSRTAGCARWRSRRRSAAPDLPDVPTVAEAGMPGLRGDALGQPCRARRHAARDRATPLHPHGEGPPGAGVAAGLPRCGRRCDRARAGAARRFHPIRVREVGQGRARHRRNGELSDVTFPDARARAARGRAAARRARTRSSRRRQGPPSERGRSAPRRAPTRTRPARSTS